MISFIIIGRNEGWILDKCFKSVYKAIDLNKLKAYEVIYIDSDSIDESIEIARSYLERGIKIYQLKNEFNAAIARNVGVVKSVGEVLFFIDGDMEIESKFIPLVYNEEDGLKYDFVSGQVIDYNYDFQHKFIDKKVYHQIIGDEKKDFTTGGLFLLKRELWFKVGGMKNKLRRNQDLDLGLRLAKMNVFLLRRKELFAAHHTISYYNITRMWLLLFNGSEFFSVVLLRDNFRNKFEWKMFIRENYSSIFLLFIGLSCMLLPPFLILIYFILVFARIIRKINTLKFYVNRFLYVLVKDILLWFALIFFWPTNNKNFKITEYNKAI